MYLLLLLLLFVQLPPAAQHGHKAKKVANVQQQDTPKQQPSPSVTPFQNPDSQPSPTNTNNSQTDAKKNIRDWINAFSTAVIACLTLLTVIVIARQLRATHRQERAWVVIEEMAIPDELSHWELSFPVNVELKYVFKNYGSTPARLTESRFVFTLIDRIEDLPTSPDYGEKQPYPNFPKDGGIMVPGATIPLTATFQGANGAELTNEILVAIRDGSKCLVAYGFIKYRDAFHKRHETRFCHKYVVEKRGINFFSGDFLIAGPPAYNRHS
ncbi:MAG TPA: hypothetical protein VFR24_00850 [Candidatus Angelobacter sp.]|nr:hypothetical protein [Candidatus Angelobacter sp.]